MTLVKGIILWPEVHFIILCITINMSLHGGGEINCVKSTPIYLFCMASYNECIRTENESCHGNLGAH